MDAATILVLVLSAGVIALLAWFEINSRRNEANSGSKTIPAKLDPDTQKKKSHTEGESDTQNKKAA